MMPDLCRHLARFSPLTIVCQTTSAARFARGQEDGDPWAGATEEDLNAAGDKLHTLADLAAFAIELQAAGAYSSATCDLLVGAIDAEQVRRWSFGPRDLTFLTECAIVQASETDVVELRRGGSTLRWLCDGSHLGRCVLGDPVWVLVEVDGLRAEVFAMSATVEDIAAGKRDGRWVLVGAVTMGLGAIVEGPGPIEGFGLRAA
jgi:hypothetical protein